MPIQYPSGIISEHLATRRNAGLFDVSHMGRFKVQGAEVLPFLQHMLSNNAAALNVGESQYTMIPDENGGAIDDAYLYRFVENEYLLVVNAVNRKKDWDHLFKHGKAFRIELSDITTEMAMVSLQGPFAKEILSVLIRPMNLPEPIRNKLNIAQTSLCPIYIARTGYTGEPTSISGKRAIGLALIDSRCKEGDQIRIDVRGKRLTRANARNPSQEKISVIQKSPKATFDSSSPRH